MGILPRSFIETLSNGDFLLLILVTIIGQIAAAFLILSLIVSVFLETGSNFGVSGVILSFAAPGLLMAFAGLFADLFDRRKIIVAAFLFTNLVMAAILISSGNILVQISLSFLYFCGNAFFIPAATAASAQLVKKSQLLSSNSLFVFCLSGGQLLGFMLAAVVHFFFGTIITMVVSVVLLLAAFLLATMLPVMLPREKKNITIFETVVHIFKVFVYIFGRKKTWFYFVILAFMQGIIALGVTLAPGFFDEMLKIPIEKSLILVFPMVGLGALIGAFYVHNPNVRESRFLSLGIGMIGVPGLILGLMIILGFSSAKILFFPVCGYLVMLGFGVIVSMIASRTVLQKLIAHNYLGTVFGANAILAALISGILSPLGAGLEALFGYVFILVVAGLGFSLLCVLLLYSGNKWKF